MIPFFDGLIPEGWLLSTARNELSILRCTVSVGRTVAGAQRKISVHLSREGGMSRLTPVGYPARYTLKPPAREYLELPELEHLVMASRAGIKTVSHGLIPMVDGNLAYITCRGASRRSGGDCTHGERGKTQPVAIRFRRV